MPQKDKESSIDPGVLAILEKIADSNKEMAARLEGMSAKAYIEEQKKPTQEQLQKKAQEKWRTKEESEQKRLATEAKRRACGHVHPKTGQSRMFKVPVALQQAEVGKFPKGAGVMICSGCQYKIANYKITHKKVPIEDGFYRTIEEVQLIHNPEFDEWYRKPSVSDGQMFGA